MRPFGRQQRRRTTQISYLPNGDMMLSKDPNRRPSNPYDEYQSARAQPAPFKSRHISLHPRITSLTGDDTFDEKEEEREAHSPHQYEIPTRLPTTLHNGRDRPPSFVVLDKNWRESYPAPTGDYAESVDSETRLDSSKSPSHPGPLKISTPHEILFVGVVIMSQFLAMAGLGQSIAPLNIIAKDFAVTKPGERAWFPAAFSLTVGTFILISGRMGDTFGHKRVFVFGYFFLGCWSAFAGFSAYVGSQILFDVCRAFQGIGAALLVPNAFALLRRAYPPGIKKNIVYSLFGAMAPWGFVVGTLFASMFAQLVWWPWTHWSYGIAAWVLAALSILVIPKVLASEAQFVGRGDDQKPDMDCVGSLLGVTGLILINVALINGPIFGWNKPHVYFILIFGVFCLVGFVWVEYRALSPLLPVRAMNTTVTSTMLLVGLGWGSFGIWVYYSFRFLEEIRDYTPLSVSVQFTPALICGLLAAGVTGLMLTHTPVAFALLISTAAFFVGQLVTATQPVQQTYWAQMFVAILIITFGKLTIIFLIRSSELLAYYRYRYGHVLPIRNSPHVGPSTRRTSRRCRLAR